MEMIPHQIHMTPAQIRKVGGGMGVNLKHSQMGADKGDVVIMLKPQSARKMLTAYRKGKGMRLCMSPEEIEETMKHGGGFFKSLKKYTGINKTAVISSAKRIGKEVIEHGSEVAGTAIGAYLGDPAMGMAIGKSLGKAGTKIIDSVEPTKAGVKFSPNEGIRSIKSDARKIAVEAIDKQLDKMPPEYRAIGEKALAGSYPDSASAIRDVVSASMSRDSGYGLYGGKLVKGSPEAKAYMKALRERKGGKIGDSIKKAFKKTTKTLDKTFTSPQAMNTYRTIGRHAIEQGIPLATTLASMALGDPTGMSGAMVGNVAQEYASKGYSRGTGIPRPRGRPRKVGGASAMLSAPYRQALKLNKNTYGLSLGNFSTESNAPLSAFETDKRVRPSSTEMTLSPYQSLSSPAMNPFVPTYATQAGGTMCGYGGRGLY
jgi:hypothetical protein